MPDRFDVLIIGGGVIGAAIARELSQYRLRIALLEKEIEPAFGVSKSNSGIIHPGTHNPPGSLKGRLCVEGNRRLHSLARDLGVDFKEVGELVVIFREEDRAELSRLKQEAENLGVPGLRIVDQAWLREQEPLLNPDAVAALYAPTAGIVSPYRLVYDLLENAAQNGVALFTSSEVTAIERNASGFLISTRQGGRFSSRFVVNAAGLFSDQVARLAGINDFVITPRKGEEFLLDKKRERISRHLLFPLPTPVSKGTLIIKTSDGNPMIGPTAEDGANRDDLSTTDAGLENVLASARRLIPSIKGRDIIAYFAGLRPVAGPDFIVRHEDTAPGMITVAGIQSPGLTAAPAIAAEVAEILRGRGLSLRRKWFFHKTRKPTVHLFALPWNRANRLINRRPAYGDIVCRCEMVSAQEIREAVRRGARTLDGIKFRTRAQAGRCHGGFCTTRILRIMAEELGLPVTALSKRGPGSEVLAGARDLEAVVTARHRPLFRRKPSPHFPVRDLVIVGGGPAGMAAAVSAWEHGVRDILLLERDQFLGGILNQCIHPGFGLQQFKADLTGPEFAGRWLEKLRRCPDIQVSLSTFAVRLTPDKQLTYLQPGRMSTVQARALIMATGCRERTREMIPIPGDRPAGVFPAGLAQKMINLEGWLPGREVVIVGSGDIGLIMARRFALEGATVKAVVEIKKESRGLVRNVVQCLEDFGIPLYLRHKVAAIRGARRVERVEIARVDDQLREEPGTRFEIPCDTVLISVGLIPENELIEMAGAALNPDTNTPIGQAPNETSIPGLFVCGNAFKIYDLADSVTRDSIQAGRQAAAYLERSQ
ncbi:MAG: FAD-dependent oxidoreductase [candidate division FCPU426 bacterium]